MPEPARRAQLLVPQDHEKFPAAFSEQTERRLEALINAVRRLLHMSLDGPKFRVVASSNQSRTNERVINTLFGAQAGDSYVRVIYSDKDLPDTLVKKYFSTNRLIVVVKEGGSFIGLRSLSYGIGCRVQVRSEDGGRLIEDVLLDVFLGGLHGASGPVRQALKQSGVKSLFRAKAAYFKGQLASSWIGRVDKDIGYAPLSSLNQFRIDEVDARAQAAIEAWKGFEDSLTLGAVINRSPLNERNTDRVLDLGVSEQGFDALRLIPQLGGQLSPSRIARAALKLPSGDLYLVVLTRGASAGKSPKWRSKIRAVLGPNKRRNSFVFFAAMDYSQNKKAIEELLRAKYVAVIRLRVDAGSLSAFNVMEAN